MGASLAKLVAQATVWAFAPLLLRLAASSDDDWNTSFLVGITVNLSDGLSLAFGSLMAAHELVAVLLVMMVSLFVAAYIWRPAALTRRSTGASPSSSSAAPSSPATDAEFSGIFRRAVVLCHDTGKGVVQVVIDLGTREVVAR